MKLAGNTLVGGSYGTDSIGYSISLTLKSTSLDDLQMVSLSNSINNADMRVTFVNDQDQAYLGMCKSFTCDALTGCVISLTGCVKV
jgi:hypothetical protein